MPKKKNQIAEKTLLKWLNERPLQVELTITVTAIYTALRLRLYFVAERAAPINIRVGY